MTRQGTANGCGERARVWSASRGKLLILDRPRFLGILNVTPDSFSDGGVLKSVEGAVDAAAAMIEAGADGVDIGGESTRPGAAAVSEDEQKRRILPVVREMRRRGGILGSVLISIDTTRAGVARAALDEGADSINDVSAGTDDPAMLALAAERNTGLILMHRLTAPDRDSYSDRYSSPPEYGDVVGVVRAFLAERAAAAERAGVVREAIVLDPGLGFGKTVEQNLELVRRTAEIASLGYPVLSGASRKSFVGRAMGLTDSAPAERLAGSIAISVAHWSAGARIFRVHDVGPQRGALMAAAAVGRQA
jgi:dihydropteroate synthase